MPLKKASQVRSLCSFFLTFQYTCVFCEVQPLMVCLTLCFQFTVIARDDGYPQLTDQASVQINIIRDQFTPTFSRTDYFVTILETANINETITNVVATDEDRQVSRPGIFSRALIFLTPFPCISLKFISF